MNATSRRFFVALLGLVEAFGDLLRERLSLPTLDRPRLRPHKRGKSTEPLWTQGLPSRADLRGLESAGSPVVDYGAQPTISTRGRVKYPRDGR
jgi:hypothetical protein